MVWARICWPNVQATEFVQCPWMHGSINSRWNITRRRPLYMNHHLFSIFLGSYIGYILGIQDQELVQFIYPSSVLSSLASNRLPSVSSHCFMLLVSHEVFIGSLLWLAALPTNQQLFLLHIRLPTLKTPTHLHVHACATRHSRRRSRR